MISVTLSTTQSILIFSAFCIAAITLMVALFRTNKVRAAGAYKGARLSLEACNQQRSRKAKRRHFPKQPQLPNV
jgi:hypothetical protein